jgi:hypothetical protein
MGEVDEAFEAIGAAIEDRDAFPIDSLRTAGWWTEIRADPRYRSAVELLASKEIRTDGSPG